MLVDVVTIFPEYLEPLRHALLAYLAARPDACARACAPGHLTASALVVDADGLVIATSPQTLQLQGEILHSVGNNAALAARQPMISDPYQ